MEADLDIGLPIVRGVIIGTILQRLFDNKVKNIKDIKSTSIILSTAKTLIKWHSTIIKKEAQYGIQRSLLRDIVDCFKWGSSKIFNFGKLIKRNSIILIRRIFYFFQQEMLLN